MPVMGEQITAEKRARIAEEVRLHKAEETESERVSDTVRTERAEVSADPADLVPEDVDGDLDAPPRGAVRADRADRRPHPRQ